MGRHDTTTTVLPASRISRADLAALWTDAFSDYYVPGAVTVESLEVFERSFDLDFAGSRIVVAEGRPVAFGMLGVRGRRGWVGGMGVIPSARRRGHGERVMRALIEESQKRQFETLGLEVLVENEKAIPLYEALEFRILRKLEVWDRAARIEAPATPAAPARELAIDEAAARIAQLRPERAPWQRELEGVRSGFPDVRAMASSDGRALIVFRVSPERIGIAELAVDRGSRDAEADAAANAALDQALATLFAAHPRRLARLLNLAEGDFVAAALERAGAAVSHRQWEMELAL